MEEGRREGRLAGVGDGQWGEEARRWKWLWEQEQEQHGGMEEKPWGGGCLDPLGCTFKGGGREQKVPNRVPETEELPHRRAKQGSGVTGSLKPEVRVILGAGWGTKENSFPTTRWEGMGTREEKTE